LKQEPIIEFRIECYHYETVIYTETRYNDSTKSYETVTRTREEKRITFTKSKLFKYKYWIDLSVDIKDMLKHSSCLRIQCLKKLLYYDELTEHKLNKHYNKFVNKYKHMDVHHNSTNNMNIDGFYNELLVTELDHW